MHATGLDNPNNLFSVIPRVCVTAAIVRFCRWSFVYFSNSLHMGGSRYENHGHQPASLPKKFIFCVSCVANVVFLTLFLWLLSPH